MPQPTGLLTRVRVGASLLHVSQDAWTGSSKSWSPQEEWVEEDRKSTSLLIFPTLTHYTRQFLTSVITFPVFSTFPPQKTVQGLVFKLPVLTLKHPKEKLHCKRLA